MDKDILRSIGILTLVCVVCTLLLSIVYVVTEPYVNKQILIKTNAKYVEIFPMADDFEKISDVESEVLLKGSVIGRVIETVSIGYGGEIKLLVGIYENDTIAGVRVLEQAETPGLGAKIVLPEFLIQFMGKDKSLQRDIDVDTITGATISTDAVIEGVKLAYGIETEKYDARDSLKNHISDKFKDDNETINETIILGDSEGNVLMKYN